jgi:DNA modification methylase
VITLVQADARALPLDDASVQCVVTSPPYWGLRDYGVDGQLGLEPTPDEYVANMVAVFREIRRVLRDDGVVWLNLGDSYASGEIGRHDGRVEGSEYGAKIEGPRQHARLQSGLKPKDLVGIPWRVAFALQADGWYLRSDIIWSKPNPMPESVTDRPTKSHEYLFLLTKRERYFYDADAVREGVTASTLARVRQNNGHPVHNVDRQRGYPGQPQTLNIDQIKAAAETGRRNLRTVWEIPTAPYPGAHFATFPPALVDRCLLAGSRKGDTILDPFGGTGTVALVAAEHGRDAIICDLSAEYLDLARSRLFRVERMPVPDAKPEGALL